MTEPLKGLLDRDFSKVATKELIDVACPLLRELVNYGTHAWKRCESSTSKVENEDLAAVFLYLHVIEMIDGIECLLRESCCAPAIPLLRSSFEGHVALAYILEKPSTYVQRSLAWMAGYARNRLQQHRALEPASDRGKAVRVALQSEPAFDRVVRKMHSEDQASELAGPMTRLLSREQFSEIEAEYARLKSLKIRSPEWYRLFDGPGSLLELCEYLGPTSLAAYELLYRRWSSIVHASDLSRFITSTAGEKAIWSLRNPNEFVPVAAYAATFILADTKAMLARFRPEEDLTRWYLRDVRERYQQIANTVVDIREVIPSSFS